MKLSGHCVQKYRDSRGGTFVGGVERKRDVLCAGGRRHGKSQSG
jgi:hypothetical protein